MKLISKGLMFASEIHINQRRKNKDKTPYVNHLIDVYDILVRADIKDENILISALLHDVIEDTKYNYNYIKDNFNSAIADMVFECTDDKKLEKHIRKLKQIETIEKKSEGATLVKIADKISNLKSLIDYPPEGWNKDRLVGYIFWSKKVVEPVLNKNKKLEEEFYKIYNQLVEKYKFLDDTNDTFLNYYIDSLKKVND